jgi:hypothetical protein
MTILALCCGPRWIWIHDHWKEAFFPASWSNWALVLVGGAAAWAALKTLRAIKEQGAIMREQANQMTSQTRALAESVSVAKQQAEDARKSSSDAAHTAQLTLDAISEQAEHMEKQAALAGKTIVLQFRPKIVVRVGKVAIPSVHLGKEPYWIVEFTLINAGGSSCRIVEGRAKAAVITSPLPDLFANAEVFGAIELQPGESAKRNAHLSDEVIKAVREADMRWRGEMGGGIELPVFFVGVLSYEDNIGIRRTMGWYRQYKSGNNSFILVDDPDREYAD